MKTNILKILCFAILSTLAVAQNQPDQPAQGKVEGVVTFPLSQDRNGNVRTNPYQANIIALQSRPIQVGKRIDGTPMMSTGLAEVTSTGIDSTGRYILYLDPGEYVIRCETNWRQPGVITSTGKQEQNIKILPGRTTNLSFSY